MMRTARETTAAGEARTILTFRLQGETFAIGVDHVQEIIDPLPTTPVPCAPATAPGIVNVRGSVVPVLDIFRRLGLSRAGDGGAGMGEETTRMVVLDVDIGDTPTRLAFLADSVEQVIELPAGRLEPVPEIGIDLPPQHLDGVARLDGELVVLLNTESVFGHAEPMRRPV